MYTITPRELSCYCPIWHIPSITAVPRSHSITPVPSCSVIASVQDKRLISLFSAVEPILPRAFNRPVLAPSLYVPNSRHQRSLLPGDVSIRGRQSSVASRRRKKKKTAEADKTQIQSNCFFIGSLEQATSNEDEVREMGIRSYVLQQQHTESRLSSGISINTSSPYRPLEKPSLIPFYRLHASTPKFLPFVILRRKATPFLWKVGSSSENSIFVVVVYFPPPPLHLVRILVFSPLLFFVISFFLYYTGSISLVIVYLSSVLLGDCCEKEEVKDSKVTIAGDWMTASPCHSLLSKIHNRKLLMGLKP